VSTSDAQQYSRQMNLTFFETSAKDNKNVDEAFYAVTRLALRNRLEARSKLQATQNNDMTNGGSHSIRLKPSGKSKKKDKKHNAACCK
jgi:Ras-related protein Rab-35